MMQIKLNRNTNTAAGLSNFQVFDLRGARKATLTRSSGLVCPAAASYRCYCCCRSAAALPLLLVQHPYAYRVILRTTFFFGEGR